MLTNLSIWEAQYHITATSHLNIKAAFDYNRIGKAANAFNRLLPVMRHKSIKMPTKIAIYQAVVLSTLLYGSESLKTTVQEEKRLARPCAK